MNKNTIIGMLLLLALFMGMTWWNGKNATEQEQARKELAVKRQAQREAELKHEAELKAMNDTLSEAQKDSLKLLSAQQDSLNAVKLYGPLVSAASGEEQIITLQNELLSVSLNTRGGMIESVLLKNYINNLDSTQLQLFDKRNNKMSIFFEGRGAYRDDIDCANLYFQPIAQSDNSVTMRLQTEDGGILDFVYTLSADSYLVGFDIQTQNFDRISNERRFNLKWNQKLLRTEIGRDFEERYSSLFYRFAGEGPTDDDLESSSKNASKTINGSLTWFNFKNQFFSSMLISRDLFKDGELTSSVIDENEKDGYLYLKDYAANVYFDMAQSEEHFCFFFGPNNYSLLDDVSEEAAEKVGFAPGADLELEHTIYLGWPIVRWVNRFIVLPFFHWLDSYALNYGLIILLLTLLIKGITFPFTYKSYLAGAKMRVAQRLPEVQKINEKYPNQEDAMAKQQELMALYGKMGVSQMGGCVPMLFQWPVLIALFYFFPTSIELRGESFLWAKDLSTYDAILTWDTYIPVVDWIFHQHISLFCILMTVTNLFYTWLMQKQNPAQQGMPGMKAMMYLMPLMFLAILNNYSAGLSYYYFLSTLFGIIQTYAIRASLNDNKILEQLKYNMSHPKKKSEMGGCAGLAARAQEAQKMQQQQAKAQARKQYR